MLLARWLAGGRPPLCQLAARLPFKVTERAYGSGGHWLSAPHSFDVPSNDEAREKWVVQGTKASLVVSCATWPTLCPGLGCHDE